MANTLASLVDKRKPTGRDVSRFCVGAPDFTSAVVVPLPPTREYSEIWIRLVGDTGGFVVGVTAASPISDDDGYSTLLDSAWELAIKSDSLTTDALRLCLTVISAGVATLEVEIRWAVL